MLKKLQPDQSIPSDPRTQLETLLPQAFADGQLDWDRLRALLADPSEDSADPTAEPFGLSWPGKQAARRLASQPSRQTLAPQPGVGVHEEQTRNVFIEGDNLEVLKLLQKSYVNSIKLIYIDPPYNTGKDFVYRDQFAEETTSYLRRTGQTERNGAALTTNTRSGGRFHTNWLNMIYPRLLLARNLLCADGLIIVSIDDGEVGHLRLLLDEVFGEENFVTQFVWNSSTAGGIRSKHVNQNHEYALCYARDKSVLPMLFAPLSQEAVDQYNREDARGRYREKDFAWRTRSNNANQRYLVECPDGTFVQPPPGYLFRFIQESFQTALAEDRVVFKETETSPLIDGDGQPARWNIYIKKYLGDATGAPSSLVPKSVVGLSNAGTDEIKELFDDGVVFNNPKSTAYLRYFLQVGMGPDDIVLDFFAGSGSTADAVLRQNCADGGRRRFILVQLPEPVDGETVAGRQGFETIADIARERLRRASARLQADEPPPSVDLGFRCYRLAPSNLARWADYVGTDVTALQQQFDLFESPLVEGWRPRDVLTEIVLRMGFPLHSTVTEVAGPAGVRLQRVTCDDLPRRLWLSLDAELVPDAVTQIPALLGDDDIFVCLEHALCDQAKLQLADGVQLVVI